MTISLNQVVQRFREGGYNTLVATCVGEEGLDIGEVDLIVCFDAHKSPIRLVQRMGRTGRKRGGRIVVIVAQGKEEQVGGAGSYPYQQSGDMVNTGCVSKHIYCSGTGSHSQAYPLRFISQLWRKFLLRDKVRANCSVDKTKCHVPPSLRPW